MLRLRQRGRRIEVQKTGSESGAAHRRPASGTADQRSGLELVLKKTCYQCPRVRRRGRIVNLGPCVVKEGVIGLVLDGLQRQLVTLDDVLELGDLLGVYPLIASA